jgi:hypothetical protein
MKRSLILGCLVTLALALAVSGLAQAQTGGSYDLTWGTAVGGGATDSASAGSGYTLGDTIGQVNADMASGGGYTLTSGFWSIVASTATAYHVFLPITLNGVPTGVP